MEDDDDFDETIPHTFDEWNAVGMKVNKGEKATGRNRFGIATFTPEQVNDQNDMIMDPFDEF